MNDFKCENPTELDRLEAIAQNKPASELKEILEPGQKITRKNMPDFKTRLNALKAGFGGVAPKKDESKLPESVPSQVDAQPVESTTFIGTPISDLHPNVEIVPGDMGKPQNEIEALVEADRQFSKEVVNSNVEAATDKMLNAEMLFTESLAEKSMDRERFKAVFINTVQAECAGLTLEEIEESIRRDHEMLFDKRTGIQAKLAYRAELLKDATAEERAKRLKDDWLFKPNKKTAEEKKASGTSGASKSKKPAFDPAAAMRATLTARFKAKGLSDEEVKAKVAEQLSKFGL